jgi:hypothetical protein
LERRGFGRAFFFPRTADRTDVRLALSWQHVPRLEGSMTRFVAATLTFILPLALAASVSEAKEKQKSKPKGDQQEYLKVEMKDAMITSYGRTKSDSNKNQGTSGGSRAK